MLENLARRDHLRSNTSRPCRTAGPAVIAVAMDVARASANGAFEAAAYYRYDTQEDQDRRMYSAGYSPMVRDRHQIWRLGMYADQLTDPDRLPARCPLQDSWNQDAILLMLGLT